MAGLGFLIVAAPLIVAGVVLAKRVGLSTTLLVCGFGMLALWAFASEASP